MVNKTNAFQVKVQDCCRVARTAWCAEASDLTFPVGRWPMTILLTHTEGRDALFVHARVEGEEGAVHIYESVGTREPLILTVFND
jgi:hypothetical protein